MELTLNESARGIVREFAGTGPHWYRADGELSPANCFFCDAVRPGGMDFEGDDDIAYLEDPNHHERICLWRRAWQLAAKIIKKEEARDAKV